MRQSIRTGTDRVTIAQVAREAGVSKTSVSRFLGGEFDALSQHLREQIDATIKRLGYQPSQMARGLKGGRTRLIGMLVADILNPYSVAVLHGAEAACQKHGYTLMLCNTGNDEKREKQSLAALHSYSVEGLLFNTQGRSVAPLKELGQAAFPVVLLDRRIDGCDFDLVGLDNVNAARLATQHLLAQGYTDIALVVQPLYGVSSRQGRQAGFLQAMAGCANGHGETLEVHLDQPGHVATVLREFFERRRHSSGRIAILAGNGMVSLQIALALQSMKLQFPDDVGLLCFDELAWSPLVGCGISTIEQPTYEIGFTAIERLLVRINGERSVRMEILLDGRLIHRKSSCSVADDEALALCSRIAGKIGGGTGAPL
ncbi:LacI family DNA-binding transcriptional regulator [Herbaspirillum sp. alder98]|uniref:LacI family DNA-binding transcriptional regulator n=1 Tax=Herbaspirillum sp. alder98 TaxID=2913096 RepID=UPI001CD86B69|nr:LacI family DNA-binding transcriptional regulator [Herbaspirillum sp. alder98]MCA1324633.1 LacI family DNA-binding transcriptional regulator [Herbaspirillum sp. alder98]